MTDEKKIVPWPRSMGGHLVDRTADEVPISLIQDGCMISWTGRAGLASGVETGKVGTDDFVRLLAEAIRFQRIAQHDGRRLSDPIVQFVARPEQDEVVAFGFYLQDTKDLKKLRHTMMVGQYKANMAAQTEAQGGLLPGLGGR